MWRSDSQWPERASWRSTWAKAALQQSSIPMRLTAHADDGVRGGSSYRWLRDAERWTSGRYDALGVVLTVHSSRSVVAVIYLIRLFITVFGARVPAVHKAVRIVLYKRNCADAGPVKHQLEYRFAELHRPASGMTRGLGTWTRPCPHPDAWTSGRPQRRGPRAAPHPATTSRLRAAWLRRSIPMTPFDFFRCRTPGAMPPRRFRALSAARRGAGPVPDNRRARRWPTP